MQVQDIEVVFYLKCEQMDRTRHTLLISCDCVVFWPPNFQISCCEHCFVSLSHNVKIWNRKHIRLVCVYLKCIDAAFARDQYNPHHKYIIVHNHKQMHTICAVRQIKLTNNHLKYGRGEVIIDYSSTVLHNPSVSRQKVSLWLLFILYTSRRMSHCPSNELYMSPSTIF